MHDVFNRKQQTVAETLKDVFEGENMKDKYYVLGYRTDLYFYDYRLAIEIDEFDHLDRDIECEKERERILKEELNCVFIRINPDEGPNVNINGAINKIIRHIKESIKRSTEKSTKKSVINDIRVGLVELSLEFEKNTETIHKFLRRAFKHVVPKTKKILPTL